MKQKYIFLFFIVALLFACKKNNSVINNCNLTSFPSKTGNSWVYMQTTNIDYDNLRDTVLYDTIYLNTIKDTTFNGKTMQKFECYSSKNPYRSYAVCINEASSFTQYLSEPGFISEVFRTKNQSLNYYQPFNDGAKTTTVSYDTVTILNFSADTWKYVENSMVKIEKENTGSENIMTPKGNFNCCKYKLNYSRKFFPNGIEITEYFSDKGLIKKTRNILNADFTDAAGNVIDSGSSYNTIELIDYTIN